MSTFGTMWQGSAWQEASNGLWRSFFMGIIHSIANGSLAIPCVVALGTLALQIIHISVSRAIRYHKNKRGPISLPVTDGEYVDTIALDVNPSAIDQFDHIPVARERHNLAVDPYSAARLVGCFALVLLSARGLRKTCRHPRCVIESSELYMTLTYLYCTILATLSLRIGKWQILATRYNIIVLLTSFGVYAIRNVWPLATYTKSPMEYGGLIWAKMAVLSVTALIIPLFSPRFHLSKNSEIAIGQPTYKKSKSLFACITSQHLPSEPELDGIIPLPKGDQSKYLLERATPYWEKYSKRKDDSLFDAMLRIFWREYTISALATIAQVLLSFVSPIGINRLLNYLEHEGADAVMRPWFWILCVSVGPVLRGICEQFSDSLATRADTRARAIVYQLLFERSLALSIPPPRGRPGDRESMTQPTSTAEGSQNADKVEYNTETVKNLVEKDMKNLSFEGKDDIALFLREPLEYIFCIVFLYKLFGYKILWSACGLLLNAAIGGTTFIMKRLNPVAKAVQEQTKSRVQQVTEAFSILKTVKLLGWEYGTEKKIESTRDQELSLQQKVKFFIKAHEIWLSVLPTLVMLITFINYAETSGNKLPPSVIFSSMAVFGQLSGFLQRFFILTRKFGTGAQAWLRMDAFLKKKEPLESPASEAADLPPGSSASIVVGNGAFAWPNTAINAWAPSAQPFKLWIEGELVFKPNCVNIITGPKKSGKTSLLLALLGEMQPTQSDPGWVHLSREGGVAYAAQDPWIHNATIRENILCGTPYDETRYLEVIRQCGLQKDLKTLVDGDRTEIEKCGLNISQGEKTRIGLARAIYSRAKIILLDEPLGALDMHTSIFIAKECFGGSLIQGRTILLATENVDLVAPVAQFMVMISEYGVAKEADINSLSGQLATGDSRSVIYLDDEDEKEAPEQGVLPGIPEDATEPSLPWKSLKFYLSGIRGKRFPPYLLVLIWITGASLAIWSQLGLMLLLGYWGSSGDAKDFSTLNLTTFCCLVFLAEVMLKVTSNAFYIFTNRGGLKRIHSTLVASVIGGNFLSLKQSQISMIVSTYAEDIFTVDVSLLRDLYNAILASIWVATVSSVISGFVPIFALPSLGIIYLGFYIGKINSRVSQSIEQKISNTHLAISALHRNATVQSVSIRLYGAESHIKSELSERIDRYTRLSHQQVDTNNWIRVRSILIPCLFVSGFIVYLVYGCSMNVIKKGFLIAIVNGFFSLVKRWRTAVSQLNKVSKSLKRLHEQSNVEQAPKPIQPCQTPPVWTTSGELTVKNLCGRYSKTGRMVVRGISFHIKSGERVVITGKRGSGKSSLVFALLRCIETEGEVYLDGISTENLHFGVLRSRIAVIPEAPDKLNGTLRRNLDPFQQFSDPTLNDALQAIGFFTLQKELGQTNCNLDTDISTTKFSISMAQWQIIAIARALVHDCKIVIFEQRDFPHREPSVYENLLCNLIFDCVMADPKVDAAIQTMLAQNLGANVTVLTVVQPGQLHIFTDVDKVMVLDEGRMVEFDNSASLLQRPDSIFNSLIKGNEYKHSERRIL